MIHCYLCLDRILFLIKFAFSLWINVWDVVLLKVQNYLFTKHITFHCPFLFDSLGYLGTCTCLRSKAEAGQVFKQFTIIFSNNSLKEFVFFPRIRGECISQTFQSFLQDKGIDHHQTCPYTPKQNGVSKWKSWHIIKTVRTLLLDSQVPNTFWCEATHMAIHLINRFPSRVLK